MIYDESSPLFRTLIDGLDPTEQTTTLGRLRSLASTDSAPPQAPMEQVDPS